MENTQSNTQTSLPPKIERRLKKMDTELILLLENMKDYSENALNKNPKPNKWSALQIMQHLILAEGYAQKYVKKKLSFNPELKNAGVVAGFRRFLLRTYMRMPFGAKAPEAVSGDNLPVVSNFWEVAKKWKHQRMELREMLESFPQSHFKKEIYKNPVVGRLSISGMLDFYESHFNRHRSQIQKILDKSFKIKD